MSTEQATPPPTDEEQPPPLLGSWRNIYTVLVVELLATTAALYALTRWLS
jgi:hypothetical protein